MNSSKTLFFMCFGKLNVFPSHMLYLGRLPRYILTVTQVYLLPIPPFLMLIWVCVLGEEMPRLPFSQPPPPALLGKCQDISKNKLRDIISAAFSTLPVRHVQNTSLERAGCIRIRCLNHLNWLPSIWILLRVLLE